MDNKQQHTYNRQGTSSKTCLSTDSRKSTDSFTNKPWPRNSRRRENSAPIKNDSQRSAKQQGQAKVRPNVDKRPKARGGAGYNGAAGFHQQNSSFEDADGTSASGLALDDEYSMVDSHDGVRGKQNYYDYEINSVYAPGSKKQNLNHLLNFHYTPREHENSSSTNMSVFGRSTSNSFYGKQIQTKKHKYNKEQFMQANFQFVIKANASPKITASPDALIDWDLIEQININTTEEPQCPICLYPPIAAKMTRCGHAYCWPCILHYLALSDKTWRKCPICYEAVHIADLKSTTILQQAQYKAGDYISFQLMRRKKGSLFIEKYTSAEPTIESYPQYSADKQITSFSKFLISNRSNILEIIDREYKDLTSGEDINSPEFVFIQQALDLLNERKSKLQKQDESNEEISIEYTAVQHDKFSIDEAEEDIETSSVSSSNTQNHSSLLTASLCDERFLNTKYYYFYQSVDGQNIFLHPLNIKMLQACYGSLDKAPQLINAKIIQKEHHSMDEDNRRKFTCIGHLPLTCQFAVVEVQLDPPIISEAILKLFQNDILLRKKERQRREREEKKREKHIDEINDRQMGKLIASTSNVNINSSHEFPTCGFEESLVSSPLDISEITERISRNSYSSVANINGSPNKTLWPSLGLPMHSASPKQHDFPSTYASGLRQQQQVRRPSERSSECGSVNSNSGDEILRSMHTNLGDVLAEAINQKKNISNEVRKNVKKSKKNKKMVLFSTGMNFEGN